MKQLKPGMGLCITVGQLKELLRNYNDNAYIYFKHSKRQFIGIHAIQKHRFSLDSYDLVFTRDPRDWFCEDATR